MSRRWSGQATVLEMAISSFITNGQGKANNGVGMILGPCKNKRQGGRGGEVKWHVNLKMITAVMNLKIKKWGLLELGVHLLRLGVLVKIHDFFCLFAQNKTFLIISMHGEMCTTDGMWPLFHFRGTCLYRVILAGAFYNDSLFWPTLDIFSYTPKTLTETRCHLCLPPCTLSPASVDPIVL